MQFSMSQASLPVFELHLNALAAILDKAEAYAAAKKIDPAVLLRSRLSPDMFDLTRQVQVSTDQARRGASRLAGAEAPSYDRTDWREIAGLYALSGVDGDGRARA